MAGLKRRVFTIHLFDLIAAMVFMDKKVTPEDITHHLYSENWADADKYEILEAVKAAFKREMAKVEEGVNPYGLRKSPGGELYWLSYSVQEF